MKAEPDQGKGGGGEAIGATVPGPDEKEGPPISDKKFVNSVLKKKKDPFGFKFNQIKYEKFKWPLNHFCML